MWGEVGPFFGVQRDTAYFVPGILRTLFWPPWFGGLKGNDPEGPGTGLVKMTENRIEELLRDYGRTFSDELGIDLVRGTPSGLFQWLIASLLLSARIRAQAALAAARALSEAGWTTAEKMAATSWDERTAVLNRSGYARYDESTSRMLGATVSLLMDSYGGDLRRLREAAGRDPAAERKLLKEFKGIGDVGVDIFFREAQTVWDELYPFADRRALAAADELGVGGDVESLARQVSRADLPRLIAALVRVSLKMEPVHGENGTGKT